MLFLLNNAQPFTVNVSDSYPAYLIIAYRSSRWSRWLRDWWSLCGSWPFPNPLSSSKLTLVLLPPFQT